MTNITQPMEAQKEKLSETDTLILEVVKSKVEVADINAKLALSQLENARLTYKNILMQLARKYNLTSDDTISETGEITRKEQK